MKAMIDTSDRKWNQYSRVSDPDRPATARTAPRMPYLRASISTIRNSAR
jgi:hypothetical protein